MVDTGPDGIWVVQPFKPLMRIIVPGIKDAPEGLNQSGRTEIFRILFGDGTGGRTAGAKDTANDLVDLLSIFRTLEPFLIQRRGAGSQVGTDLGHTGKERVHIDDQIFEYFKGGQRLYNHFLTLAGTLRLRRVGMRATQPDRRADHSTHGAAVGQIPVLDGTGYSSQRRRSGSV